MVRAPMARAALKQRGSLLFWFARRTRFRLSISGRAARKDHRHSAFGGDSLRNRTTDGSPAARHDDDRARQSQIHSFSRVAPKGQKENGSGNAPEPLVSSDQS